MNGATWAAGAFASGVDLDGTDDFVSVANSSSLALGDVGTIEAWVKLRTLNRWNSIVAKGSGDINANHNYGLEVISDNRFRCVLGNGSASRTLTSVAVAATGRFYHVACTWNGSYLRLYINGVRDSSRRQLFTPLSNNAPLAIGQFGGLTDYMAGIIDEVRIYNRARTATEVQTDMNTAIGTAPPPPSSPDTTPPAVTVTSPVNGTTISGVTTLGANASDNVGVAGVQFFVDGAAVGAEDTTAPYAINWDSTTLANGAHNVTAQARDADGNRATSPAVAITVNNVIQPAPASGPVAAYGLNEGTGTAVADASGNGNSGTLTNGATWTAGKFSAGVALDGVNDFVNVANSSSLALGGAGTVEAWVKLNALNRWNSIVAKGSGDIDANQNYGLEVIDANRFRCILGNGTASKNVTSVAVAAAGQFYHVACAWNGSSIQLYINGVLDASTAQTFTPATNSSPMAMGQFGGLTDHLAGVIDEVRIYNRALSASEVQADMNTPVGGSPPPPSDSTPPTIGVTAPVNGTTVSGTTAVSANASDDVGVAGVQFLVDGIPLGAEDTAAPYSVDWNSATVANGSHNITAQARDAAGNKATSTAVAANVNNVSPPAPTHSVDLTWNASTSIVAGYKVYRATASQEPYQLLAGPIQSGTSYTDMAVTSGTTYYYAVTAVDAGGQESIYSNVVSAVVPNP